MSKAATRTSPIAPPADVTPPLQTGDRLTRAEFERRYAAMPGVNKAQLIEGVVYMPSPVRHRHHSQPHMQLCGWLSYYISKTSGLSGGDNGSTRLDEDNEIQPDAYLMLPPQLGGSARVDENDFITGPPELVAEVSASSVSIDLHAKMNAYRRNGVREYLVWRVDEAGIDWFTLTDGRYQPLPPDQQGVVRSDVFPGLWLDAPAMLRGDLAAAFAAVDRGCATDEHAALAKRLSSSS